MGRHLTKRCWLAPWAVIVLPLAPALLAGMGSPVHADPSATASEGCAGPVAGQHVYDCAHLLTPAEVSMLEARATEVERAGAPTVVYLQVRDATAQQALQDAIDLMNR